MIEFTEVNATRILNPTSIDLGEYVINPFLGCEFACLYCYVRSNRVVSRKHKEWGRYVDIRVNAALLLEKELMLKKPRSVLLGSTTECFQPVEGRCGITRQILEILNTKNIPYVILTRSPDILRYQALLKRGPCSGIYFTVNNFIGEFKAGLEPRSPSFESRLQAISQLLREGLPVVPYFSPLLPWVSRIEYIFDALPQARKIEFECLNFNLANIIKIVAAISKVQPELEEKYLLMTKDEHFYRHTFEAIRRKIENRAKETKKRYNIHIHNFRAYFNNKYSP